jgi:hypothetical protein
MIVVRALGERRAVQAGERLKAGALWQDDDLVFATAVGTMLDQHNVRREFRQITKAAGLARMRELAAISPDRGRADEPGRLAAAEGLLPWFTSCVRARARYVPAGLSRLPARTAASLSARPGRDGGQAADRRPVACGYRIHGSEDASHDGRQQRGAIARVNGQD